MTRIREEEEEDHRIFNQKTNYFQIHRLNILSSILCEIFCK